MPQIRGYVFDAYGTLFDVHSVVEAGREITADPVALSQLWRQKQLEYTWLRSLMGRYEDFWTVTDAALRYAIRRLGLSATEAQRERLMAAYLGSRAFPRSGPRSTVWPGAPAPSCRTAPRRCSQRRSRRAGWRRVSIMCYRWTS